MTFTKQEQETSIVWDEEEKVAHIYASSPISIRRLDNLAKDYPEIYKCVWTDNDGSSKKYEVGKNYIKFRKPQSEAQKEAAKASGERLAQYRLAISNNTENI